MKAMLSLLTRSSFEFGEREREREEADGDDILIHHSLNLLTSVSPPSSSSPMDTSSEWSVSLMTGQVCCNEASLLQTHLDTPLHQHQPPPSPGFWGLNLVKKNSMKVFNGPRLRYQWTHFRFISAQSLQTQWRMVRERRRGGEPRQYQSGFPHSFYESFKSTFVPADSRPGLVWRHWIKWALKCELRTDPPIQIVMSTRITVILILTHQTRHSPTTHYKQKTD